jgi:benzaldehyde dehydrogenase (NAD)
VPRDARLIIEALPKPACRRASVNFVTNAPADAGAVVEAMVAHPAVRRVNFTGLDARRQAHRADLRQVPEAGRAGARRQGAAGGAGRCRHRRRGERRGLRRLRQLGPDLHVDRAHRGRREAIADEFVAKLRGQARRPCRWAIRARDPVVLGSVVDMSTVERCNALIDDALAKGAKLVCGGKATNTLMPATVLDHVTPAMRSTTRNRSAR